MEISAGSPEGPIVTIRELNLGVENIRLIEGLSLQLSPRARIGLTGPSGCGKTTLIRSLVQRQLNDASSAETFAVASGRIGYVSQRGGLLPWYSLRRNVEIFSNSLVAKATWCDSILNTTDLTASQGTFPPHLSGGESQRARIACAIASQPALCCADEPLTEVGFQQKWKILHYWTSEINARGTSLMLASHDIDLLIYLCDEIVILGGPGLPAKVLTRIDVKLETHPRDVSILNSDQFSEIRRTVLASMSACVV